MIQRYYFKDFVPPILIPYLTKDEPIKAFQSSHTSGAFSSILHPVKIVADISYNFKNSRWSYIISKKDADIFI